MLFVNRIDNITFELLDQNGGTLDFSSGENQFENWNLVADISEYDPKSIM